jgi:allantoin racemase
VIGIAEAAMHMATLVATRFSMVTTLPRTLIIARHLLHQYGFYDHCAGLHAIDLPVLALEDGSGVAQEKVRARCIQALKRTAAAPSCWAAAEWRPWPGADARTAGAGHRWRQRGGEDGGVAGGAGSVDQQTRRLAFPEGKALSGKFQAFNTFSI